MKYMLFSFEMASILRLEFSIQKMEELQLERTTVFKDSEAIDLIYGVLFVWKPISKRFHLIRIIRPINLKFG